jgi:hypothetical protein
VLADHDVAVGNFRFWLRRFRFVTSTAGSVRIFLMSSLFQLNGSRTRSAPVSSAKLAILCSDGYNTDESLSSRFKPSTFSETDLIHVGRLRRGNLYVVVEGIFKEGRKGFLADQRNTRVFRVGHVVVSGEDHSVVVAAG